MIARFKWFAIVIFLLLAGWTFLEYQKTAGAAEAQITADINLLSDDFVQQIQNQEGIFSEINHSDLKLLKVGLVQQSINKDKMFVRDYHALFIHQANKTCLLTRVIYPQRTMTILEQRWLDNAQLCLP